MIPTEPGWGQLRRRDGDPIFAEPWHAQVTAMADLLVASGRIAPARWARTLGDEVEAARAAGKADDAEAFFAAVFKALERVLAEDGNVSVSELVQRRQEWERAYARTPHGLPVELRPAGS